MITRYPNGYAVQILESDEVSTRILTLVKNEHGLWKPIADDIVPDEDVERFILQIAAKTLI